MDIFEVQNTVVSDGDEIFINFESNGEYVLSLVDEFTNITYTNEKIEGKQGSNSLRIYTRALPKEVTISWLKIIKIILLNKQQ
jgi:hypothetical protein